MSDVMSVPPGSLPEPVPSSQVYGETEEFGGSVPVAGIAGDQQAALYGQACHEPGLGKNTYGAGSFVLQNAGSTAPDAHEGLVTTVAWGVNDPWTTRSRPACSSPARRCSGCATASGSSA